MQCRPYHRPHREQGSALVFAVLFTFIVLGIVVVGHSVLKSHRSQTETRFRLNSQANQFARAGMTEVLTWFRRQTAQPVTKFEPKLDVNATTPILDTDDPDIGLVREFQISGTVWGRYEAWKQWDQDPDPVRAQLRKQLQLEDVSYRSGNIADGSAWKLRAVGYVFVRNDENSPFDQNPNRVLSTQILETEISRLRLSPPTAAAIYSPTGESVNIGVSSRVDGGTGGAGIAFARNTGWPQVAGEALGNPGLLPTDGLKASVKDVFGVDVDGLRSVADEVVTLAQEFPMPLPKDGIVVADVPIIFGQTTPLLGRGLVLVNGDVVVEAGSSSEFSGLLYVNGNVTIHAPTTFSGAIVVGNGYSIQTVGASDWVNLDYDADALNELRVEIGQYRRSSALRPLHGGH